MICFVVTVAAVVVAVAAVVAVEVGVVAVEVGVGEGEGGGEVVRCTALRRLEFRNAASAVM